MNPTTRIPDEDAVPLDTIFRTLSHPTRRRILTTLSELHLQHSNPVPIDELTPAESINARFLRRLYHTHLPQLDSSGFLNWNPDTETIAPGPHYDTIHPIITLLKANQDDLPTDWP